MQFLPWFSLQERILVRTQHDCVTIPQFHIPSHQSKHLRMKEKLVYVQNDLRGFANQIDEIYAKGVVDGFAEKSLNCNWTKWMIVLKTCCLNTFGYGNCRRLLWGELELEEVYKGAKTKFGPYMHSISKVVLMKCWNYGCFRPTTHQYKLQLHSSPRAVEGLNLEHRMKCLGTKNLMGKVSNRQRPSVFQTTSAGPCSQACDAQEMRCQAQTWQGSTCE